MAVDRLAPWREQQAAATSSSHTPRADNYEMSGVASAGTGGMEGFYSEISSLQDGLGNLRANVARIGDLHSRTLEITNDSLAQNHATQLEDLVQETRILIANLKQRIKDLEMQPSSERDGRTRKQQIALVRSKFVETIQHYQTVEQEYRSKYKQRIERQYKIVKPDASPEEVKAVVDSERSGQIFAEAMLDSTRYGASKGAYLEVQSRHEDIKRIERTLAELTQLFTDMSEQVIKQDETLHDIHTAGERIVQDVEDGLKHTEKAVEHARSARRKRWICFFIILLILVVIGIALGVHFGLK